MIVNKRIAELDALRGIAALSVCLFHFSISEYLNFGVTGVDLFFMISGFVIFMSLTKIQRLADFCIGRVSRLFPAYWVSIIIAICTFSFFANVHINLKPNYIIGNLFMIQPIMRANYLVDAYWTLYVELTFYCFMGLIWYLKKIDKIENIVLISLALTTCANTGYLLNHGPLYERLFIIAKGVFPLIVHFNLFAAGIVFFKIYKDGYTFKRVIILIISLLLVLLVHSIGGRAFYFMNAQRHFVLIAIYYMLFILLAADKISFLNTTSFSFFGSISYSLYLIHQSFGIELSNYLKDKINIALAISTGILSSIILAALISRFIERPILKWSHTQFMTKKIK
jgi:peptidoglycan/LPS O-acetylase OafA/YrhL